MLDTGFSISTDMDALILNNKTWYGELNKTSNSTEFVAPFVIWDIPQVRATFLVLYTLVFSTCFIGNLAVILVITLHYKMRSLTNFCLANLAVADFCVGIFCVYQNYYVVTGKNWTFGSIACKLYYFVNEMSHTASILILVVICIERYLAIIHPMRCKELLTLKRLRFSILSVWITSGLYSLPKVYYTDEIEHEFGDGETETICTLDQTKYDAEFFEQIHMVFLFFIPLLIISILYTIIGISLWRSSKTQFLLTTTRNNPVVNDPIAGISETSSSGGIGLVEDLTTKPSALTLLNPLCSEIFCCCGCREKFHKLQSYFDSTHEKSQPNVIAIDQNCVAPSLAKGRLNCTHVARNENRTINTAEPIVVVKFKENCKGRRTGSSDRKRRAHCTILMNSTSLEGSTGTFPLNSTNKLGNRKSDNCSNEPSMTKRSVDTYDNTCPRRDNRNINHDQSYVRPTGPVLRSIQSKEDIVVKITNLGIPSSDPLNNNTSKPPKRLRIINGATSGSKNGKGALSGRRKVIKMLVIIVLTFTFCNLPYHARKIWQILNRFDYFKGTYNKFFSNLFTPLSFIIMYAASGINPIIYALYSNKFRQSLLDLMSCRIKRARIKTPKRNMSLRSTHLVPLNYSMT